MRTAPAGKGPAIAGEVLRVFLEHLDDPSQRTLVAVLMVTRELTGARRVSWSPTAETSAAGDGGHGFATPAAAVEPGFEAEPAATAVRVNAPVVVDGVPRGAVEAFPGGGGLPDPVLLAETAACVAALLRTVLLQAESDRWDEARRSAQTAAREGRSRLAGAELLERSRLAATVLDRTGRVLDTFTEAVERLRVSAGPGDLAAARSAADSLTSTFRTLARGVHPLQLRTNRPGAALIEVGHELGRTLTLLGEPTRASWEVESGLFWAVDAVLRGTGHWPLDGPVVLRWASSGGRRTVDVVLDTRAEEVTSADRGTLAEVLEPDVRRLEALGGGASVAVRDHATVVTCWLPESLGGATAFRREPWRSP